MPAEGRKEGRWGGGNARTRNVSSDVSKPLASWTRLIKERRAITSSLLASADAHRVSVPDRQP